jgi:uncharacterized protein (TIGR02099 family)
LFKTSLQRLISLTHGLLWVAGVLWVVLAAGWGVLTWVIVPRIDEFRPWMEQQASLRTGLKVRIGQLEASSGGLVPSFELQNLSFSDSQGHEALVLPRVWVAISPTSLWRLGLDQIYIESPSLDIRRDAQGHVWVAGVDVSGLSPDEGQAADWVFSQTEWVVRGGALRWTDEFRQRPTLELQQVEAVLRNSGRSHQFRLDATPPKASAERFSLRGSFKEPLLSLHSGQWQQWDGQVFAQFNRLALATLPWEEWSWKEPTSQEPSFLPRASGDAAVRLWADVKRGKVSELTVDTLLQQAQFQSSASAEPLRLNHLSGRWGALWKADQQEWWTQDLQWTLADGLHWPGGNVRLRHVQASQQWEVQADQLDLQAMTRVALRLPLSKQVQQQLASLEPKGQVEKLQAQWTGSGTGGATGDVLASLRASGRVRGLELLAQDHPNPAPQNTMGRPGVRGLNADFEFQPEGGKAQVSIQSGRMEWPGLFEDPAIALGQLSTDISWQVNRNSPFSAAMPQVKLQLPNLKFSNDDTQGEAQIKWQTSEAPRAAQLLAQKEWDFGLLDVQGSLARANVAKVHKYLPLDVSKDVRDYLRDALVQGKGSQVKFKTRGDLNVFPFASAEQGEFRISGTFKEGIYLTAPRSVKLQGSTPLPLPQLTQVQGQLLIDRNSLSVKDLSARMPGPQGLRLQKASLGIEDFLRDPTLQVGLETKGPLQDVLTLARGFGGTQVNAQANTNANAFSSLLAQTTATGLADVQLKLKLPLNDLNLMTLQGKATFQGNDIQAPDVPKLQRVRGVVQFTESGFAISGGQARALGGDLTIEGGSLATAASKGAANVVVSPTLKIQGSFSADGLRQATELGAVSQLARHASGSANYQLTAQWQRGVPQVSAASSLQGLALNLPAPLNKLPETLMPLRLETSLTRESFQTTNPNLLQEHISLELGRMLSAQFVRDLSPNASSKPRVLRGAMAVGLPPGETLSLPPSGVVASVQLDTLDLDAWSRLMAPGSGAASATFASSVGSANTAAAAVSSAYMPSNLSIRAREVLVGGRQLHRVVAGGSHDQEIWRLNVDATELSGYVEYRQPTSSNPGRVYARLARLVLPPSSAKDVETLLEEQPASVPALDIVVDDLELRGRKLGRVEIDAVNRNTEGLSGAREWRLNRFNVTMPEAVFTATGQWSQMGAGAANSKRRTSMNFKLDIADSGELLNRFGMKDLIRQGKGKLEGQVSWQGSPLSLDYPSLGGGFNVNMESGQFMKADPGLAKLLGVLSLQALPRRLALDFRDVFSEGFAFDFVRGDVLIEQGMARTNNLQMRGVNLAVLMEGRADLGRETQDLKVVVVPEINTNTATLVTTIINPAVGLGSFLAQWILRRPIIESTTQEFHITGSWADPVITRTDAGAPRKNTPKDAPR